MSWDYANEYARWTGGRLPTEAEWEKACRGTDARIYPWGNEAPTDERLKYGQILGITENVGSYPKGASPYGLLDMAGNVDEWTNSMFGTYPYRADDGREEAGDGLRVLRGGAFGNEAGGVRCASRFGRNPSYLVRDFGFRVVASPIP